MDVAMKMCAGCVVLAMLAALSLSSTAAAQQGELDLRFGIGGLVFVDGQGGDDQVHALAALPDGGSLAAGRLYGGVAPGTDFAILRMNAAGQLVPGWGNGGIARLDVGTLDAAFDLLPQADGGVLAAGRLRVGAYTDSALVRFNALGQVDTGFGQPSGGGRSGYSLINLGSDTATNDEARALATTPDGRIVIAAVAYVADGGFKYPRFALARFTADGQLDAGFGSGGSVVQAPTASQRSEYVTGIARRIDGRLPDDGRITVVGYVSNPPQGVVRRYLANGQLDPSFGTDGTLVIDDTQSGGVATGLARIDAAVLQEDGKLVVAGTARDRGFTFIRLLANGSPDPGFGSGGRRTIKFSGVTDYDAAQSLRLMPNGSLLAAGYATVAGSKDFAVVRLLPSGAPDPAFGDGGGRKTLALVADQDEAQALTLTADGSVLVAGYASSRPGSASVQPDMAFMRLLGDPGLFSNGFE